MAHKPYTEDVSKALIQAQRENYRVVLYHLLGSEIPTLPHISHFRLQRAFTKSSTRIANLLQQTLIPSRIRDIPRISDAPGGATQVMKPLLLENWVYRNRYFVSVISIRVAKSAGTDRRAIGGAVRNGISRSGANWGLV